MAFLDNVSGVLHPIYHHKNSNERPCIPEEKSDNELKNHQKELTHKTNSPQ